MPNRSSKIIKVESKEAQKLRDVKNSKYIHYFDTNLFTCKIFTAEILLHCPW
jgi:hypothetical protein